MPPREAQEAQDKRADKANGIRALLHAGAALGRRMDAWMDERMDGWMDATLYSPIRVEIINMGDAGLLVRVELTWVQDSGSCLKFS